MSIAPTAMAYDRAFNFSAGPCTLPVEVLEEARDGLINWNGLGLSVMEMSHRSAPYEAILNEAIADLRSLMNIPSNYKVLFLQGGASLQFTMICMNFRGVDQSADYSLTGSWGTKAYEAALLQGGNARLVFDAKSTNYDRAPQLEDLDTHPDAAFCEFTSNETIQGVDYFQEPPAGSNTTWICDMSSNILSRPVDVSRYAMIFAGAQKNMGPAGNTVAIIRDDLFDRIPKGLPPMLDYQVQADNNSMYNTPPCWSIYMAGLVYKYMLRNGGVEAWAQKNEEKAKVLYDVIDESEFYTGHALNAFRSCMNVTFRLPDEELTKTFLKGAAELRMLELKGHRSVGGCRASIYNAFPIEGCRLLAEYMRDFEAKHG